MGDILTAINSQSIAMILIAFQLWLLLHEKVAKFSGFSVLCGHSTTLNYRISLILLVLCVSEDIFLVKHFDNEWIPIFYVDFLEIAFMEFSE